MPGETLSPITSDPEWTIRTLLTAKPQLRGAASQEIMRGYDMFLKQIDESYAAKPKEERAKIIGSAFAGAGFSLQPTPGYGGGVEPVPQMNAEQVRDVFVQQGQHALEPGMTGGEAIAKTARIGGEIAGMALMPEASLARLGLGKAGYLATKLPFVTRLLRSGVSSGLGAMASRSTVEPVALMASGQRPADTVLEAGATGFGGGVAGEAVGTVIGKTGAWIARGGRHPIRKAIAEHIAEDLERAPSKFKLQTDAGIALLRQHGYEPLPFQMTRRADATMPTVDALMARAQKSFLLRWLSRGSLTNRRMEEGMETAERIADEVVDSLFTPSRAAFSRQSLNDPTQLADEVGEIIATLGKQTRLQAQQIIQPVDTIIDAEIIKAKKLAGKKAATGAIKQAQAGLPEGQRLTREQAQKIGGPEFIRAGREATAQIFDITPIIRWRRQIEVKSPHYSTFVKQLSRHMLRDEMTESGFKFLTPEQEAALLPGAIKEVEEMLSDPTKAGWYELKRLRTNLFKMGYDKGHPKLGDPVARMANSLNDKIPDIMRKGLDSIDPTLYPQLEAFNDAWSTYKQRFEGRLLVKFLEQIREKPSEFVNVVESLELDQIKAIREAMGQVKFANNFQPVAALATLYGTAKPSSKLAAASTPGIWEIDPKILARKLATLPTSRSEALFGSVLFERMRGIVYAFEVASRETSGQGGVLWLGAEVSDALNIAKAAVNPLSADPLALGRRLIVTAGPAAMDRILASKEMSKAIQDMVLNKPGTTAFEQSVATLGRGFGRLLTVQTMPDPVSQQSEMMLAPDTKAALDQHISGAPSR